MRVRIAGSVLFGVCVFFLFLLDQRYCWGQQSCVGIEDEGIVEVLVGSGKLVRCGDPDMDMGFLCINLWFIGFDPRGEKGVESVVWSFYLTCTRILFFP